MTDGLTEQTILGSEIPMSLRRDAPEQNIKDKQSICIIPDYTGKGAAARRQAAWAHSLRGRGNQFKKVKPRRVGRDGEKKKREMQINQASTAICHSCIVRKSGLAEKEEWWKRGQPSIHPSIPLHTWPYSRFVQW